MCVITASFRTLEEFSRAKPRIIGILHFKHFRIQGELTWLLSRCHRREPVDIW